jgi:chromosome partitioning protein
MALVYAVVQQKGGAGKTTLVANLAAAWAGSRRVAMIDVDPQRSLSRWHTLRAGRVPAAAAITLSEIGGWRLAFEIGRLREGHDIVLIDTAGQLDLGARLAVRGADRVLLPMQPSAPDLWATTATTALAAEERRPCLVVLNRVGNARLRADMAGALATAELTVAAAVLGNRSAFAASFAVGLGVVEGARKTLAGREVMALRDEIAGLDNKG